MNLPRTQLGHAGTPTLGTMTSRDGTFTCVTLERSADGEEHVCIPAGTYTCRRAVHHPGSPHGYPCWEICDVPGRSYIHIHVANRQDELEGCIAPGERVDGDAIDESKAAFDRLMAYTDGLETFQLTITDPSDATPAAV